MISMPIKLSIELISQNNEFCQEGMKSLSGLFTSFSQLSSLLRITGDLSPDLLLVEITLSSLSWARVKHVIQNGVIISHSMRYV